MRAHIRPAFHREGHDVFLFEDAGNEVYQIFPAVAGQFADRQKINWNEISETPSFSLGRGELAAVLLAATDTISPDKALGDHLKDTREVRDRLLTMVEGAWQR